MASKWKDYALKMKADDPPELRCVAGTNQGPCPMRAVPGHQKCIIHGGAFALATEQRQEARQYMLGKYTERMNTMSDVKNLTGEIAMVRALIQTRLVENQDPGVQQEIVQLLGLIRRIVDACTQIEKQLAGGMDRLEVQQLINNIVAAVGMVVDKPEVTEALNAELCRVFEDHIPLTGAFKQHYTFPEGHPLAEALKRFSDNNKVRNLTEEICLCRIFIEEALTAARTPADFSLAIGTVRIQMEELVRLVMSAHRVDMQLGNVLPAQVVRAFASSIISIVRTHVSNKETLREVHDVLQISLCSA